MNRRPRRIGNGGTGGYKVIMKLRSYEIRKPDAQMPFKSVR